MEPGELRIDTVPDRIKAVGDPSAEMDAHVGSLARLLEQVRRDEEQGLGDGAWPPNSANSQMSQSASAKRARKRE